MTKVIILLFGILMSFTCCNKRQVEPLSSRDYDIVTQTYLRAYLDSLLTDSIDRTNYNLYVKEQLDTLPIPNAELDALLVKYGFSNTKDKILQPLRKRTKDLNSIDSLLSYERVQFNNPRTKEVFKATYNQLKQQYTSNESFQNKKFENMWIIELVIAILILLLCIYLLWQLKKQKEDISYLEHQIDRINSASSSKVHSTQGALSSQQYKELVARLNTLENETKRLTKQPIADTKESRLKVDIANNTVPLVKEDTPTPTSTIFAKTVSGGVLKEGTGNACVYRIFDAKNGLVNFEFVSTNISYVLENKNAIFDNVAECKGNSMSATNIKSIKPGTAKEIEQGRWEVVTKTQIEFIK